MRGPLRRGTMSLESCFQPAVKKLHTVRPRMKGSGSDKGDIESVVR